MIERPASRYGRQALSRRQRRWIVAVLTVLVLAAALLVAVVAAKRFGGGDVSAEVGAFRLIDDRTVEVTVNVTRRDPSQPVVCIVRARSVDGSETGRREVLVPPSEGPAVQVTTVVVASAPPAVGDVYGCGTDVPPYLVAP